MKYVAFIMFMAVMACQPTSNSCCSHSSDEPCCDALTGSWMMTDLLVMNSYTGDTVWNQNYDQYKMFAHGSVMWCSEMAPDSTEWFGYGTYSISGDTLTENMVLGSTEFMKFMDDSGASFNHSVTIESNSYTQVSTMDSLVRTEVYERVK